jgi:diguanylate cyclase (GGDEF)-like protein/PAS domain S-box-containing protein
MNTARTFRFSIIGALSGALVSVFTVAFTEQASGHNIAEESLKHFLVETPVSWTLYLLPVMGVIMAILLGGFFRRKELHGKFFEALFENSPLAITTLGLENEIITSNPAFEKLFGFNHIESVGKNLDYLITNSQTQGEARQLTANAQKGKPIFASVQRQRKDGHLLDVDVYGVPVFVENKKVGVLGLYHDVTAQKKALEALRESEEKYRDIYDNVSDFLYTHDLEGNITNLNPAFEKAVGLSRDKLLKMNIKDFMPDRHKPLFRYYLSKVTKLEVSTGLLHVVNHSGQEMIIEYKNSLIKGPDGPLGVQGSARDITARKELETNLKKSVEEQDRLARTDTLTDLLNRRGIYEQLEGELNRSQRDNFSLTIALIDLDGLKFINDTYGHSQGDHAIKSFADSLKRGTRNYDSLGRLGGDEFLMVLPQTGLEAAEQICQRISADLNKRGSGVKGLSYTFSAGLATFRQDEKNSSSLDRVLSRADKALYIAKQMSNGNVAMEEQQQPTPETKSLASVYRR